jgi:hypothetical protein
VLAKFAFLDGVQNQNLDAVRFSDPAVAVALGASCVRKSRRDASGTRPGCARSGRVGRLTQKRRLAALLDAQDKPALRDDRGLIAVRGLIAAERAGGTPAVRELARGN